MMNLILLFLFMTIGTYSFGGEIDPSIAKLCENVQKIQSIAQTYEPTIQIVTSPVAPFTGLVFGMTTKTNVIVELCEFVNAFQELEGMDRIRLTKNFTNNLTENKWADHFAQADRTWTLLDNAYDFESGESRPGYLGSVQSDRDLTDFMKETKSYVDKNFNGDQQDAAMESAQIAQLTQVISKKAIIQDAINCPDTSDNPNYKKIYESDIKPYEIIKNEAQTDVEYFHQKLLDLGTAFLGTDPVLYDYNAHVEQLDKLGIQMGVEISTKNVETTKPGPLDSKGKPKVKKTTIAKEVHTYSVKVGTEIFQKFEDMYAPKWKDWVTLISLTKTSEVGLFFVEERLTKEMRDLSYECKESKLMSGIKEDSKGYAALYEKKKKECEENLVVDEKNAENIISYYITNYKNALYKKTNAIAKIWSAESDLLGINRYVSKDGKNSAATTYQAENVKCSDELSAAQMDKLDMAQQSTNAELKEIILKNRTKLLTIKQKQLKQKQKLDKESQLKQAYNKRRADEFKKTTDQSGAFIISPGN